VKPRLFDLVADTFLDAAAEHALTGQFSTLFYTLLLGQLFAGPKGSESTLDPDFSGDFFLIWYKCSSQIVV